MKVRKKEENNNDVKFELVGGIGNQLFIYYAATYFTSMTGIVSRLDLSSIGSGGTNHGRTILDFNLEGDFVETNRTNSFSMDRRIKRKVVERFPKSKVLFPEFSRNYISPELGYDSNLINIQPGTEIHGYFQSWKYYEGIFNSDTKAPALKKPSEWYIKTLKEMDFINPTVIHVRIGDYQPLRQTFGILSGGYYKSAINKIDKNRIYPIWLFSDEVESASEILDQAGIAEIKVISPPVGTSPAESLMLMSYAKRIILGNSSFSWWAARLGDRDKVVVYPEPWFKNSRIPNEMNPPNWLGLKSSWW